MLLLVRLQCGRRKGRIRMSVIRLCPRSRNVISKVGLGVAPINLKVISKKTSVLTLNFDKVISKTGLGADFDPKIIQK